MKDASLYGTRHWSILICSRPTDNDGAGRLSPEESPVALGDSCANLWSECLLCAHHHISTNEALRFLVQYEGSTFERKALVQF